MNALTQTFSAFWSAREARERKMLAVAAAVIALSLIYVLLIAPALTGREQLRKKLPALREQALQMQALSKEAMNYGEQTRSVVEPLSRNTLEAALMRASLKPKNITVTGGFTQVQFTDASFSSTLNWLQEMQKTARTTVTESTITPLAQPDKVDAKFTLQQHQ